MLSDGEDIVPPMYLLFPQDILFCVIPWCALVHSTDVISKTLLTTHSKVTGSPVEARIVLEGMAAAGRSLNKCRNKI
jgi:hypothetical protein